LKGEIMADQIKTKTSFGTVSINGFNPAPSDGWPKGLNLTLSFEEALKLHLGLLQILQRLNTYNRATKAGRNAAVNLCIFPDVKSMTITEWKLRSAAPEKPGNKASRSDRANKAETLETDR